MESKCSNDWEACVYRGRKLTAQQARRLRSASLAIWLATVALVFLVISAALSLSAWREHIKKVPVAPTISRIGLEDAEWRVAQSEIVGSQAEERRYGRNGGL